VTAERVRVFVNTRPVDVARGATVADVVRSYDQALAELVGSGAYVTDGVGRPVAATLPVTEAGQVFRVVVTARRAAGLPKDALHRWPKVELHVHLDGSLRPDTMLELARTQGLALPADTPEALARAVSGRGAETLEAYLEKYALTLAVMQTADALERIAYELVQDAAAEHVRYLEIRYSPLLHRPALTLTEAIEAPLRGVTRAAAETGTRAGLVLCAMRTKSSAESLELARAAAAYRGAGVVGFDLAGPEHGYPARAHREAFAVAARAGLGCTCHAGETDGPDSIRQALEECGATRIGHGTRLGEDQVLLERVVSERVALEVCLTSNLYTGAVRSLPTHPMKRFLDRGAVVTLSTDARLVGGVTLTDEYHLAHTVLGLGREDLARLVLYACESAFLPEPERVALAARVQGELDLLS
jgi:adenosine deaminase